MKFRALHLTATILAAALLPSLGYGESYTVQDTIGLVQNTPGTINLAKFDTSLGTLTGVSIFVSINLTNINIQMDNDAGSATTGSAIVQNSGTLTVSVPTPTQGNIFTPVIGEGSLNFNQTQNFGLAATTGDAFGFTQTGLADYAVWNPSSLSTSDSGAIDSAGFSYYTGPGSIAFTLNTLFLTSATFGGSDGFFQGSTPNASFTAQVQYTYTAVPEPSSALLIGAALSGLTVFRRRRS